MVGGNHTHFINRQLLGIPLINPLGAAINDSHFNVGTLESHHWTRRPTNVASSNAANLWYLHHFDFFERIFQDDSKWVLKFFFPRNSFKNNIQALANSSAPAKHHDNHSLTYHQSNWWLKSVSRWLYLILLFTTAFRRSYLYRNSIVNCVATSPYWRLSGNSIYFVLQCCVWHYLVLLTSNHDTLRLR